MRKIIAKLIDIYRFIFDRCPMCGGQMKSYSADVSYCVECDYTEKYV
jgi:tRNA(Ile2) C34 agmatinyltransferase TiaS